MGTRKHVEVDTNERNKERERAEASHTARILSELDQRIPAANKKKKTTFLKLEDRAF